MRTAAILASSLILSAAATAACSSSNNGSNAGGLGADGGASSGGDGGGGSSGSSGSSGDGGSSGTGPNPAVAPLPLTTFLYVSRESSSKHVLMAWDADKNEKRVITDLTGDGGSGSEIAGYALSPDRRSIALASLYQPTAEDVAKGFSARRIFTMGVDGSNIQRLTPVWQDNSGGKTNWAPEVRDPTWTKDGTEIVFNYGEYWYEGTSLKGGSSLWVVPSAGGALPSPLAPVGNCSVTSPATDPATGAIAASHSVCIDNSDGIYLYSRDGATPPVPVITGNGEADYRTSLEPVGWTLDGAYFTFIAVVSRQVEGATRNVRGVFAYDVANRTAIDIAVPTAPNVTVWNATAAPDASAVIYCQATDLGDRRSYDLHLVDLTKEPIVDTPLTDDGKSCDPRW